MRRHVNALAYALLLALSVACAGVSREVAKDEYTLDLQGCVKFAKTREEAVGCWKAVNDKWDEAGARPAATISDGGSQ